MVCVPCIFVPVLLFIWHKFIQPYVLRFWNPWAVKDEKGNVTETQFPFTCKGDSCPVKTISKESIPNESTSDQDKKAD